MEAHSCLFASFLRRITPSVQMLVDSFENTLRALDLTDPEDPSSIKVAKIIIGLAKDGERDPARLRDLALKFLRPE